MLRAALLPQGHISLKEAATEILLFSLRVKATNDQLSPNFDHTQVIWIAISLSWGRASHKECSTLTDRTLGIYGHLWACIQEASHTTLIPSTWDLVIELAGPRTGSCYDVNWDLSARCAVWVHWGAQACRHTYVRTVQLTSHPCQKTNCFLQDSISAGRGAKNQCMASRDQAFLIPSVRNYHFFCTKSIQVWIEKSLSGSICRFYPNLVSSELVGGNNSLHHAGRTRRPSGQSPPSLAASTALSLFRAECFSPSLMKIRKGLLFILFSILSFL